MSAMITTQLYDKLLTDVQGSVWVDRSYKELREFWNKTVDAIQHEAAGRLPYPSLTDYINLALKAGLRAQLSEPPVRP